MSHYLEMLTAVNEIALYLARMPGVTMRSHGQGSHDADFTSERYKRGRVNLGVTEQQWPPAEEGAGCLLVRPTVTLSVYDMSLSAALKQAFSNMMDGNLRAYLKPDNAAQFWMTVDETPTAFTDRVAGVLEGFTGLDGVLGGLAKDRELLDFKETVARQRAQERARQAAGGGAPGVNM